MSHVENVDAFLASSNAQEIRDHYDQLAATYEEELTDDPSPLEAVTTFVRYVQPAGKILDAGCGTGKVGALLLARGYQHLTGLDVSSGMLAKAREKNFYAALYEKALGGPLDFPTAAFDGVIAVGLFLRGHAPSSSFDELIRITKPGGYLVFTMRPEFYVNSDFQDKMTNLVETNRWRWVETGDPFDGRFKPVPDLKLQVWVYQVC